jgi:hypothetical protein
MDERLLLRCVKGVEHVKEEGKVLQLRRERESR